MILMRANPFQGPLEGVGPENREYFQLLLYSKCTHPSVMSYITQGRHGQVTQSTLDPCLLSVYSKSTPIPCDVVAPSVDVSLEQAAEQTQWPTCTVQKPKRGNLIWTCLICMRYTL